MVWSRASLSDAGCGCAEGADDQGLQQSHIGLQYDQQQTLDRAQSVLKGTVPFKCAAVRHGQVLEQYNTQRSQRIRQFNLVKYQVIHILFDLLIDEFSSPL